MIYVRNDRHVTDVGLPVHDGTDLVNGKVHLRWGEKEKNLNEWIHINTNVYTNTQ